MPAEWKALRYIYRVASRRCGAVSQEEGMLNGRPCIFVRPEIKTSADCNSSLTRKNPAILCIHGMSVHGYRDERMIHAARAFASLGFSAAIPSYPEIQDLRIVPSSADSIRRDIDALVDESGRKLGLFSASFSGGLSLIAASHPATAAKVASLLLVGSYCHVDTTMDFFLHRPHVDPYGLFVLLKNFLPYTGDVDDRLLKAFDIAAQDDGYRRKERQLPSYLAACPAGIGLIFRRYLEDRDFRIEAWKQIQGIPAVRSILQAMDVPRVIDGLQASLCLLHGARDIVIPPEESMMLYEQVRRRIPASLTVTSIIDHGTLRMGWSVVREFLHLLDTIGLFFRSLSGC